VYKGRLENALKVFFGWYGSGKRGRVGILGAGLLDQPWDTLFFPYTNEISLGKNDPFAATLSNEPTQVCLEIAVIGVVAERPVFSPFCCHGKLL
jgi:hypothetical protein